MAPPPPPMADIDRVLEEQWAESTDQITAIDPALENWKSQVLPLARIKKIMKSEECILADLEKEKAAASASGEQQAEQQAPPPPVQPHRFMIAGEAPVLLGKACELLIRELGTRAWRHTERNRRRTLQRQDVHAAVGESEVFDFLIDIVPRVAATATAAAAASSKYNNVADQQSANEQQPPAATTAPAAAEAVLPPGNAPPAVNAAAAVGGGGGDEQGMSLADAELRLAQLEQMQQQYLMMQQHMQQADAAGAVPGAALPVGAGSVGQGGVVPQGGVGAPGAAGMVMNPFGYAAHQTQEQAAAQQWAAMFGGAAQQQPQPQQQVPPALPPPPNFVGEMGVVAPGGDGANGVGKPSEL